ncbi:hypothetical protein C0993_006697 [Termitomyces sp. T159_Od127]|nr:hypothetical protein C0993_006697 [Termitomyces sp. T159_Od127]
MACAVCARDTSSPANFLLTCSVCAAAYHHRCHSPVLEDFLLIALVKASTAIAKGLAPSDTPSLHNWKCAACAHPLIDLTVDDKEGPKEEVLPDSLPPRKYNLAPAWIHKQHADSQTLDAWDRLGAKTRSRGPRKKFAENTLPRQPFVCFATQWLESRRSEKGSN